MEVEPGSGGAAIKSEQQQQQDDGSADPSITVTLQRRLRSCRARRWRTFSRSACASTARCGSNRLGRRRGGRAEHRRAGHADDVKTFHFAGVSMNVTLGVPRIKEIINAAQGVDADHQGGALRPVRRGCHRTVKGGSSARTSAKFVTPSARCSTWPSATSTSSSTQHASPSCTSVDSATVRDAILALPKLRETDLVIESPSTLKVHAWRCTREDHALFELHRLRLALTSVIVCGIRMSRAIITLKEDNEKTPEEKAAAAPLTAYLLGDRDAGGHGVSGVAGAHALDMSWRSNAR